MAVAVRHRQRHVVLARFEHVELAVLVPLADRVRAGLDDRAGQRDAGEHVCRGLVGRDLRAHVEHVRIDGLVDRAELIAQRPAGKRVLIARRLRLGDDEARLIVVRADQLTSIKHGCQSTTLCSLGESGA